VKIYCVLSKHPDIDMPWLVDAWDEWSVEENPEGLGTDVKNAKKKHPACEVRTAVIEVPDSFLTSVFELPVVKGDVVVEEEKR